jgi:putative transposase
MWRDRATAMRFFRRLLRSNPVPRKIVTNQLPSYPAAKVASPELGQVKHVFVKAAVRVNNRAENSHQPTRRRERQMRGFHDARRTQAFPSCFGPIRQHFALPGYPMNVACYRAILKERLTTWHDWTPSVADDRVIYQSASARRA